MATVWAAHTAPRIGRWQTHAYSTGWSHTIHFSSLRDLLLQMSSGRGLQDANAVRPRATMNWPRQDRRPIGWVSRLGIVAHGDQAGVVQLGRDLTPDSLPAFDRELTELGEYLTPDGMVVFFSCIAGSGSEGSRLLTGLSERLPGRTIVGFTVMGETQASENLSAMSPQSPGWVREAPHGAESGRPGAEGMLDPWSVYAKWAKNGRITRSPPATRQEGNRCANPQCPGHRSPLDHCRGWQ